MAIEEMIAVNYKPMQAFLKAITFVVIFICVCFEGLASDGKCGNDVYWSLDESGVLTVFGNGDMRNMSKSSVPWRPELVYKVIVKKGVARIGNKCFENSKNLQSVTLDSSVKSIGVEAFANCRKLMDMTIPEGVVTIEERAFENCINLTTVILPSSLLSIGEKSFAGCRGIVTLDVPLSVSSIGLLAFNGCEMITDINSLPEFVQSLTCKRFGLSETAVERYRVAAKSKELQADGGYMQVKVVKTPEIAFKRVISDVDIDLPVNPQNNLDKFAFIVANEDYEKMGKVPYAKSDGTVFAQYCRQVLGMPDRNVRYYENATFGTMQSVLYDIARIDEAYEGRADIILYYVGHGIPDDKTRESFLVPCDAFKPMPHLCLGLNDLFDSLGKLKAKSVVVFFDACFSGATRDYSMLNDGERGVAIKPKAAKVSGNVAVISATAGDQVAQPYVEKGHGLFTYFLLKILKTTKGEATVGQIKSFVRENVRQVSAANDLKDQSPTANVSSEIADTWEDWQLNK